MVRMLLDAEADPDAVDGAGRTVSEVFERRYRAQTEHYYRSDQIADQEIWDLLRSKSRCNKANIATDVKVVEQVGWNVGIYLRLLLLFTACFSLACVLYGPAIAVCFFGKAMIEWRHIIAEVFPKQRVLAVLHMFCWIVVLCMPGIVYLLQPESFDKFVYRRVFLSIM